MIPLWFHSECSSSNSGRFKLCLQRWLQQYISSSTFRSSSELTEYHVAAAADTAISGKCPFSLNVLLSNIAASVHRCQKEKSSNWKWPKERLDISWHLISSSLPVYFGSLQQQLHSFSLSHTSPLLILFFCCCWAASESLGQFGKTLLSLSESEKRQKEAF